MSEKTSQCFVQRQMRGVFQQLARCCRFAGHCLKDNELPPFVGRSLSLYVCVVPFPYQGLLGVSAYLNNFLCLIQFSLFKKIYLFILYKDTTNHRIVSHEFLSIKALFNWDSFISTQLTESQQKKKQKKKKIKIKNKTKKKQNKKTTTWGSMFILRVHGSGSMFPHLEDASLNFRLS